MEFLLNDCSTESPVCEERTRTERVSAGRPPSAAPSCHGRGAATGTLPHTVTLSLPLPWRIRSIQCRFLQKRGPDGSPAQEQQRPPVRLQLRQQTMGVAEPRCAKSDYNYNYSPVGGSCERKRRQQAEEGAERHTTCGPPTAAAAASGLPHGSSASG